MKEKRFPYVNGLINGLIFCFVLAATTLSAFAQSAPAQGASDTDAGQKRLKRARGLVAAHQLEAAATELNAIRTTTTDDSVRDVARIMLMSIFLEEADYMRAQNLLEETYKLRKVDDENSNRTYFALAGQAVNGSREHLNRYRSFGINMADKDLPTEVTNDLDHMRMLLERVADQAREINGQEAKSFDALGLLEEAASVRVTLARSNQERIDWQRECADARQKLAAAETRIASISPMPTRTAPTAAPTNTTAIPTGPASPNHTSKPSSKKSAATSEKSAPPTTSSKNKSSSDRAASEKVASEAPPLKASADGQPVEIGSLIDKATQKVNPAYPQTAKQARITGVVTVYLEVDEKGAVKAVHRVNGPELLKQAAENAVRRWKFRPTLVDGQPVRVLGFINFNFTL